MRPLSILALLALAACGADGEPLKPRVATTIGIDRDGISAGTRVGVTSGPLTVSVGL